MKNMPRSAHPNRLAEDIGVAAVVVAELELCDVAREVLPTHLVEGADHTALHQRPEALDGVGMDRADSVFTIGVPNESMGRRQ